MSKVNFFAQGLGLKPLSADPTSPTDGQLYMSDGTARAAGLWRYSSTSAAWVAVGSGGGGLDVFHTEDFESNSSSDFTTGNNATPDAVGTGTLDGTLADETSSQLAGDRSLKYTMGSTSANDFFLQDADIAVELKQTSQDIGVSFFYTYNGDDNDIRFFALDQDDAELTDSIDYLEASTTPKRFSTSFYIPAGTTGIRYGFQVVTGNSSKILIVDDIELSTNPFVYKNLLTSKDLTGYTPGTQGFGTPTITYADYSILGNLMFLDIGIVTGTVTASEARIDLPSGYTMHSSLSADTVIGRADRGDSAANTISVLGTAGDTYLTFAQDGSSTITPENGNAIIGSSAVLKLTATVKIEGPITAEHVVTPAKSNMTDWTPYTPSFTGFGTVSGVEFYYKQVGDTYLIQGHFTSGTSTAVEAQMTLPNGYTVKGVSDTVNVGWYFRDVSTTQSGSGLTATSGDAFLNFGPTNIFDSNSTPLVPAVGTAVAVSGQRVSINATVQIQELSSDVSFLAAVPVQKTMYIDIDATYELIEIGSTTAYKTRTLVSTHGDNFGSISANQLSLPEGKYKFIVPVGSRNGAQWIDLRFWDANGSVALDELQRLCWSNVSTVISINYGITTLELNGSELIEFQTKALNGSANESIGKIEVIKLR